MSQQVKQEGFSSKFAHIMTLAGFCIGISNMWKFPYMVGANGGGIFLLIYLVCAVLVGLPLFILEQQLGRSATLAGVPGMAKLSNKSKFWTFGAGWLGLITVMLIACYFWTILGWNVGYIFKTASGALYGLGTDNAAVAAEFSSFSGSWGCVFAALLCAILAWFMLNTGFKQGVEKLCTYALPTLMVLLVGLAIYSNMLPGANAGLKWYLTPNFEGVDIPAAFQAAVVQVFFSVGVGMACAFVYGSYMSKKDNLMQDSCIAVCCDTFVAFMSGMVVTPALFAFGIEPSAGPGLIFISLPQIFNAMGNIPGRIFGTLYLIAVFLACLTSIVAVLEAGVANLGQRYGWSRRKTTTLVTFVTFGISVLVTRNMAPEGALSGMTFLGDFGLFDTLDCLASGFGLTFGALFMLLFVLFKYGFPRFMEEANWGAGDKLRLRPWMKWYYMIPLPIFLVATAICIIGMYF
ncbi:sodium-dependent transporter [Anaerotignum lactatifermentans]|uniref:Transporter n=1 Tax=Anaerotignum lactatifermentans TaxID=160404 RepID=A0ABS2GCB2_9FIRM|nr:sodium-dependent transporter [Anaerotignum lactatifermentans]MBM6830274.1 sodium-dependent transporter [Anaerotignum lactatifermentans]MBM6878350.1 sodium-dependent transporter [Anaerotignum lactatifermentans]MBM6951505.1 sodium-dependent transporter [Anaerotignum lactatifermentans]